MTKRKTIENHRKMWLWIAKETLRHKRIVKKTEYFEKFGLEHVFADCFCCEYDNLMQHDASVDCQYCPLDWGSASSSGKCMFKDGDKIQQHLYGTWRLEKDYKKCALLAYKISKLPERE